MVNEGPLKICETFLPPGAIDPDTGKPYDPQLIAHLKGATPFDLPHVVSFQRNRRCRVCRVCVVSSVTVDLTHTLSLDTPHRAHVRLRANVWIRDSSEQVTHLVGPHPLPGTLTVFSPFACLLLACLHVHQT